MPDGTNPKIPASSADAAGVPISEAASAHAPFLFFDVASAFGQYNNVVHVTLETARYIPRANGLVTQDRVIVGHLRMNLQAAESLRAALEGALLMARQAGSEAKN